MIAVFFATICAASIAPPPLFGEDVDANGTKGHATTDVTSDVAWIGPAQEFHIIVAITPDVGWHTYWENPGDSGAPTEIEIEAPEGYVVGEPIFPRPEIFRTQEETTYGYGKQAAIFVPVKAPSSTLDGQAEFKVTTSWLACKKRCVQGESETNFVLSVRTFEEGPLRKSTSLPRWQSALPKSLEELENGSAQIRGTMLKITGTSDEAYVSFIGIEKPGVRFLGFPTVTKQNTLFTLSTPISLDALNANDAPFEVSGLLVIGRAQSDPSFKVTLFVDNEHKPYFGRGDHK
ncbi:MAG: protein-disulfide reductase DsbD family protein [Phycisphaerales bacterium]|jgi:DsbC/DsbD-like thiol-disulfide interchange protein|nr:protein-disulfide reductase DsbD family protein [Phycisphaerales bacterium]